MRPSRNLLILLLVWVLLGLLGTIARLTDWPMALELNFIFWGYLALLVVVMLIDTLANRSTPG